MTANAVDRRADHFFPSAGMLKGDAHCERPHMAGQTSSAIRDFPVISQLSPEPGTQVLAVLSFTHFKIKRNP